MLKMYPTSIIPITHIPIKTASSFGFIAFFSITSDGKLRVVTAIIKLNTVPSNAPLPNKASATGITPNMSAYIGVPSTVANTTPNGFVLPRTVCIHSCGIQLCITAPIATPIRMYGNTFFTVDTTWSFA